jgi:hypothetical protein
MLVRITGGPGVGQVIDLIPAVAKARITGGTAVLVEDVPETAALNPAATRGAQPERKKGSRKS